MKQHRQYTKWIAGLAVFGLITALVTPNWNRVEAEVKERYADLQLFAKVLNLVQQYYVEDVDLKKLIYGGIKGMLRELDPHTNFLPPDIFKEFESETTGEFGGLGIEITVQKGVLTVISPIEDTPAWKAGIKAGDKVVEIDGESTKGMSLAEAAQKMKGKNGTKIRLGIFREGFEKPQQFVIARGVVKVKSAKYTDLDDGYAYVRLTSFIEHSAAELEKALKNHNSKYKETKGLILDLRRNPGGLLDQAVQISDLFLGEGTIVSTIGRNKKEKEVLFAKRAGTLPNFPLIVLIDEFSASASEILAGALKDNKRALIMGQRSFGKGSVQSVVKLGDGSGLKLTVARYYTPSGRSIQAEGIVPDILVDDLNPEEIDKATEKRRVRREQDIQGHLLSEEEEAREKSKEPGPKEGANPLQFWWTGTGEEAKKKDPSPKEKLLRDDFQVSQAYNYLKAWRVMGQYKSTENLEIKPDAAEPATPSAPKPSEELPKATPEASTSPPGVEPSVKLIPAKSKTSPKPIKENKPKDSKKDKPTKPAGKPAKLGS
ncbi:MAG: S41 family peptidase [Bdellovibrionales bacterium]